MAYVSPITQIILLQDVPLESDYEHTILFESLTQQENYFKTKQRFIFNQQTYQRVSSNTIRIQKNAEELYYCNYLMFINPEYSVSKWFYCFINEIKYINNEVSEIVYEVDVIQTWFFQYALQECFVEREHTNSDRLFSNIVTENLDLGSSYVTNSMPEDYIDAPHALMGCKRFDMNDMGVCIMTTENYTSPTGIGPILVANMYLDMRFIFIDFDYNNLSQTAQDIHDTLNNIPGNDIINVVQYPARFHTLDNPFGQYEEFSVYGNFSFNNGYQPNINGYTPKNKKLFSYPYNFLFVSNNCGQSATLKWEDWMLIGNEYRKADFLILPILAPSPTVKCVPLRFRGMERAFDDAISYSAFPRNFWDVDSFQAWWQANKNSFILSNIANVISGVSLTSVAPTNLLAGMRATSAAMNIAESVEKIEDLKAAPHQMHGQVEPDLFNGGYFRQSFDFYRMSIKAQQAKIIDDYFDKYGYAVKEVKVPDYAPRRPYWYYIKTIGCQVNGYLPNKDKLKICDTYDKGITFWKCHGTIQEPTVDVGNYTQDNEIDKLESEFAS